MARPHAVGICLSPEQLQFLEKQLRAHKLSVRLQLRYSILLLAHQGLTNQNIALQLRCLEETVRKWRGRFALHGLDGLNDAPRSGRPRSFSPSTDHHHHRMGV